MAKVRPTGLIEINPSRTSDSRKLKTSKPKERKSFFSGWGLSGSKKPKAADKPQPESAEETVDDAKEAEKASAPIVAAPRQAASEQPITSVSSAAELADAPTTTVPSHDLRATQRQTIVQNSSYPHEDRPRLSNSPIELPTAIAMAEGRERWFQHDGKAERFRISLSYNGAVIAAMFMMVLLAAIYLLGRHTSPRPSVAAPPPADPQQQQQPPGPTYRPDALNVNRNANRVIPNRTSLGETLHNPAQTQRLAGLNYVVVQSYNISERAKADHAIDVLKRAGIAATVENNLPTYGPEWISVVGLKGFPPGTLNSHDFRQYHDTILQASRANAGAGFKQFQPTAVKWR